MIPTPTPQPFRVLVFHPTHSQKPSLFLLCALSQNLLKSPILTLDVLLQFYLAWFVFEIIATAYRKNRSNPHRPLNKKSTPTYPSPRSRIGAFLAPGSPGIGSSQSDHLLPPTRKKWLVFSSAHSPGNDRHIPLHNFPKTPLQTVLNPDRSGFRVSCAESVLGRLGCSAIESKQLRGPARGKRLA